jgi:hypothetical protein
MKSAMNFSTRGIFDANERIGELITTFRLFAEKT